MLWSPWVFAAVYILSWQLEPVYFVSVRVCVRSCYRTIYYNTAGATPPSSTSLSCMQGGGRWRHRAGRTSNAQMLRTYMTGSNQNYWEGMLWTLVPHWEWWSNYMHDLQHNASTMILTIQMWSIWHHNNTHYIYTATSTAEWFCKICIYVDTCSPANFLAN